MSSSVSKPDNAELETDPLLQKQDPYAAAAAAGASPVKVSSAAPVGVPGRVTALLRMVVAKLAKPQGTMRVALAVLVSVAWMSVSSVLILLNK